MKISKTRFSQEVHTMQHVQFLAGADGRISEVFLRRLAAWMRDLHPGRILYISSGRRTYDEQVESKRQWPDLAATPGLSWHQYGCAVDVAKVSESLVLPDFEKTRTRQSLWKYGLYIPMNKVDSPNLLEYWHIQPMECVGIAGAARISFLDRDDAFAGDVRFALPKFRTLRYIPLLRMKGVDVHFHQLNILQHNSTLLKRWGADKDYGKETWEATRYLQKVNHLSVDGVVGLNTYAKLTPWVQPRKLIEPRVIDLLTRMLLVKGFLKDYTQALDENYFKAVRQFQERYGLVADGIAGPQVWSKVFAHVMR